MNKRILIVVLLFLIGFNAKSQNIFRTACQGNLERLDSLLQKESVNVQDDRGRSLLHWAVACKKKEVFHYLIRNGIELNKEDNEGRTAMYTAVLFDNMEFFELLLEQQKDSSWVRKYGTTLLEKAILNKNERLVKKLILKGVDINSINNRGSTPLEIAKRTGAGGIYEALIVLGADTTKVRKIILKGAYMGQDPPRLEPKLFAPNFISTEESEFGCIFNAAGTEFYFAVDLGGRNEIRYSRIVNGQWSQPEIILSHERYGYNDPFLSNDENRLYFISKRALDGVGELKDVDIWYVEKDGDGWSEPINAGLNINSDGNEYYISFTNDGTMYFSSNGNAPEDRKGTDYDIYYSEQIDGVFQKPKALPPTINTEDYEADVFVAPDESYIIFCSSRKGGFGRGDLYVSFKNTDSTWTNAVNVGKEINTPHYEYCPFVTKDGKYLFYTSQQDIYWVSMEAIYQIKRKK